MIVEIDAYIMHGMKNGILYLIKDKLELYAAVNSLYHIFLCKSQNFKSLERFFFQYKTHFFKLDWADWDKAELGKIFGSVRSVVFRESVT